MRRSISISMPRQPGVYNNMDRKIKKYLVIIASLLLIIFLLQRINWLPSFAGLFHSKPLLIDDTRVLIKEINNLSQLITISVYDEVVADSSKPKRLPSLPGLRPVPDKIVLIAKGKVLAGVDLTKMKEHDLMISHDSITVVLPTAEIFSAVINPSDFEIFDEVGTWSDDAVTFLKIKARRKIVDRALKAGILWKANKKAKAVMENFLLMAGRFKTVTVNLR